MWHASVAVVDGTGKLVPTEKLTPKQARRAQALCYELLERAGQGEDRRDRFPVAFHLRRRLSPRELALLDPAWCAIPAEDLAGEGEPW